MRDASPFYCQILKKRKDMLYIHDESSIFHCEFKQKINILEFINIKKHTYGVNLPFFHLDFHFTIHYSKA